MGSQHLPAITIGQGSKIKSGARIFTRTGFIKIGKRVSINPNVLLLGYGGIKIGNDVRIAAGTSIVAFNHNYQDKKTPIYKQGRTAKGITIENDVWIGTNCSILDGVTIEEGAVVGAGSVVTKNIVAYSVVAGNPAKVIKHRK